MQHITTHPSLFLSNLDDWHLMERWKRMVCDVWGAKADNLSPSSCCVMCLKSILPIIIFGFHRIVMICQMYAKLRVKCLNGLIMQCTVSLLVLHKQTSESITSCLNTVTPTIIIEFWIIYWIFIIQWFNSTILPSYVLSYRSYHREIIKQLDNLSVTCSPCNNISYLHFESPYSQLPICSKCFQVYLLRKTWTPAANGCLYGNSINLRKQYNSIFKRT